MVEQEHNPTLLETLGDQYFPYKQRRAIEIIDGFDMSPEDKRIMFLYHLWHESGTVAQVKRITGLKKNIDALSLVGKLLDKEELVEQYSAFYTEYRSSVRDY
jgi:hypothetical protein